MVIHRTYIPSLPEGGNKQVYAFLIFIKESQITILYKNTPFGLMKIFAEMIALFAFRSGSHCKKTLRQQILILHLKFRGNLLKSVKAAVICARYETLLILSYSFSLARSGSNGHFMTASSASMKTVWYS